MSISQQMTLIADAAAQRYGLLVDGWKALYGRALDDARFGAPVLMNETIAEAYAMAQRYLDGESLEISDAMFDIVREALSATRTELSVEDDDELPDAIADHANDFIAHLARELAIQIERDIATLKKTLQQTTLGVILAASAQRLPLRTALIQHRIAANTDIQFSFTDRRAAKWSSRRYVRTIWRHNLLSLYNDVVLMTLADAGVDVAEVRHEDPASEIHGQQISLIDTTELPTLADIRDQAFHPNANAIIARYADVPS